MRALIVAIGAALAASAAMAEDHEAGVPLSPAEAAGPWTLASAGHDLCAVTLRADYSAQAAANCSSALPARPVGWRPTAHGMALVTVGGRTLIGFERWSNSLFVSHRASGVDVQLRRGAPAA